jgi:hypothetical protein
LPTPASPTQQRVVLAAAAQDLDDALDLVLAADQRVDLAVARPAELRFCGVLLERASPCVCRRRPSRPRCATPRCPGGLGLRSVLVMPWRDEVDDVEPRHALLVQVVHRVRILLAEDRHQHVGAGDFLLAAAGATARA